MPSVHLATFDQSRDLPIVAAWLRNPHVAQWWGDAEQALEAIRQRRVTTAAMIEADTRPVGFICWQTPPQEELEMANLDDLPDDLVDIDTFIGETDSLGHGVGSAALRQLLLKLRTEGASVAGVCTATTNVRALRAYRKAGFRPFRDFEYEGECMRYLIRDLSAAAGP